MKFLTLLTMALLSLNGFAFSIIKLTDETILKKNERLNLLTQRLSNGRGSDYCEVFLYSHANVDSIKVPAGTVFTVDSIDQNSCGRDWGRVCRLDIASSNKELDVELQLMCKDKGLFAKKLTPKKVNRVSGKMISVK